MGVCWAVGGRRCDGLRSGEWRPVVSTRLQGTQAEGPHRRGRWLSLTLSTCRSSKEAGSRTPSDRASAAESGVGGAAGERRLSLQAHDAGSELSLRATDYSPRQMSPSPPAASAPSTEQAEALEQTAVDAGEVEDSGAEGDEGEAEGGSEDGEDDEEAGEEADERGEQLVAPLPSDEPPLPNEQPPLPPGPAPAAVHQKNDWAAIWSPE